MTTRAFPIALAVAVCVVTGATGSAQSPAPATTTPQTPGAPDPHAGHVMPATRPAPDPHAGHDMATPVSDAAPMLLPPFIPPVTDEMRAAAFPDVYGHAAHDRHVNSFVLVDELEWRSGGGPSGVAFSSAGWVGGDLNRLWFRMEGDGAEGAVDDAQAHLMYGRAIARWWDVVAGVRQDVRPGARTWLAVGLQGLAPGFFDVDVTAYLSSEGRAAARLGLGYDLLLTNRLVLQPSFALNLYENAGDSLDAGSEQSTVEAGVRVRYHIKREVAPYVGVSWGQAVGGSAHLAHHGDVPDGAPRLVTGVRVWF